MLHTRKMYVNLKHMERMQHCVLVSFGNYSNVHANAGMCE